MSRIMVSTMGVICSDHINDEWCSCRSEYIIDGKDVEYVTSVMQDKVQDYWNVPLMPISEVWVNCMLTRDYPDIPFRVYIEPFRVYIDNTDPQYPYLPESEYIGLFTLGEGLNQLRILLNNWFQMWMITYPMPKCKSSAHNMHDEAVLKRLFRSSGDDVYFPEIYRLYFTGICKSCRDKLGNISDLVPDPGKMRTF